MKYCKRGQGGCGIAAAAGRCRTKNIKHKKKHKPLHALAADGCVCFKIIERKQKPQGLVADIASACELALLTMTGAALKSLLYLGLLLNREVAGSGAQNRRLMFKAAEQALRTQSLQHRLLMISYSL